IAAKEALGEKPHYRFKLEDTTVIWTDLVRGEVSVPMSSLSDPVILRADGRVIYTLASVVDDIDHGITHILRGEDHTTNSAAQIQLFEALGGTPPMMGHFALLAGVDGEGLSKRLGSLSITSLREDGIEPLAIASLLGRIGTSDPIEPRQSLAEVIAGFNVSRFGRATPRFDGAELKPMNSRILGNTPYEVMADRLILDNTPYEVMANLLNAIVILGFDISSFGRATPRFDEAELKLMNSRILDNTPYEEMADLLNALVNALVILSFDISRFGRATPGFGGAELKLMNSLILDNTPYEVMADLLNALVILGFDISRFGRATPGFDGAELKLMNSRILGNTPYEEMAGLLNAIVNALVILGFDISRFGRATPGFDGAELKLMDSRILGNTLYKVMADRLNALDIKSVGIEGGSASFWNAIRGNIETVAEAEDWFDIATLPISPIIEDASLLLVAQNCLPEGATTADTWGAWTKAIMAETGLKGRAVFMPLRLALTGQSAGPELQGLLPLMGRERILARLNGEKA
ncbi:MAG: glutamate--tRNA ligase, partial [Candidatus Puniceispirillales bacterium WSBS_2018_MAG_OTU23]